VKNPFVIHIPSFPGDAFCFNPLWRIESLRHKSEEQKGIAEET